MLIRFGLGGQLSGSVGGVVASHNRSGQYLRNRSVPVNPNSVRQQEARNAFGEASIAWRSLTASERTNWEAYAVETPVLNKFGESINVSGNSMFIRTNAFLIGAGASLIETAPVVPGLSSLGAVSGITIVSASGTYTITLSTGGNEAQELAIVQIGPSLSAGKKYFRGPYTLAAIASTLTGTSIATAGLTLPTRYGIPVADGRYGVRVRGVDDAGRLSNVYEQIVVATAV